MVCEYSTGIVVVLCMKVYCCDVCVQYQNCVVCLMYLYFLSPFKVMVLVRCVASVTLLLC